MNHNYTQCSWHSQSQQFMHVPINSTKISVNSAKKNLFQYPFINMWHIVLYTARNIASLTPNNVWPVSLFSPAMSFPPTNVGSEVCLQLLFIYTLPNLNICDTDIEIPSYVLFDKYKN